MRVRKLICFLLIMVFATMGVFADSESKIVIGQKYSVNNKWAVPVMVTDNFKTYSISTYDATFTLTSVSGDGYSFKDGCTSSLSTTGVTNTSYTYSKITLSATSKEAAQTAFESMRYTITGSNPRLQIEGIENTLGSNDVFLNGHIYRYSSTRFYYFKEAMNWCFNQGGYPVTITSDDENLVAFIFFKKLNGGTISGSKAGNYTLFYLGIVPANYKTGSITVAKNASGVYQVSTTDSVSNVDSSSVTARRSTYRWIAGTPEAGLAIPTKYWCGSTQPDSGGPVVYGHGYNGVVGSCESWDDHDNDKWTASDSSFDLRACAEIEPDTTITTANLNHDHAWVYTADNNVLTATCKTDDCSNINTVTAITLTADVPLFEGTLIDKNSIFEDVDFEEFNVYTGKTLSASDIKVYRTSDSTKTALTELTDGDFTAELTCNGATATLAVNVPHNHIWTYSKVGTKLVAKCIFSEYCPYNSNPATARLLPAHYADVTAAFDPETVSEKSLTWTFSSDDIVDFNTKTGLMKSLKSGSTTLMLKTNDGENISTSTTIGVAYPLESVSLNKSSASVNLGSEVALTATISPEFVFDRRINWESSDTSVATVSNGTVKGVGLGTATITATTVENSKTASCDITVTPIAVTEVKLNKSELSVQAGNTATLTVEVLPSNASNKSVTWSSSNTTAVTVDSRGKLTLKAAGTAVITVTSAEDTSKKATCTVKVSN